MASTNKTENYDLSQYIGSDIPSYIQDYNSDMLKIDNQMKANNNNIKIIQDYFNLVNFKQYNQTNFTYNESSHYTFTGSIYLATNKDNSVFKIYGFIRAQNENAIGDKQQYIIINTPLRPKEKIIINSAGFNRINTNNLQTCRTFNTNIIINTDGRIELNYYAGYGCITQEMCIFPCLYFLKNFGDIETNI